MTATDKYGIHELLAEDQRPPRRPGPPAGVSQGPTRKSRSRRGGEARGEADDDEGASHAEGGHAPAGRARGHAVAAPDGARGGAAPRRSLRTDAAAPPRAGRARDPARSPRPRACAPPRPPA